MIRSLQIKSPLVADDCSVGRRVVLVVLCLISLFWVEYVHLDPTSGPIGQYAALLAVGGAICCVALSFSRNRKDLVPNVACALVFTLVWGREIFCGYLYYDEIGRPAGFFPLTQIFVTPVNDHVTPWMHLVWGIEYRLLHGAYWAISLIHYLFGLLGVWGTVQLTKSAFPGNTTTQTLVGLLSAVCTLSPRIWIWKGCGDSPVIAWAIFIWLLHICRDKWTGRCDWGFWVIIFLYIVVTGASSLITLGFLFFLPFFVIRRFREWRFVVLFMCLMALSALYWWYRSTIVHAAFYEHDPKKLFGALCYVVYFYVGKSDVIFAIFSFLGVAGIALAIIKRNESAMFVWCLGLLFFLVGSGQIWGARGLVWGEERLTGYHLFLPFAGLSLILGAAVGLLARNIHIRYAAILMTIVFYGYRSIPLANSVVKSNQAVIQKREIFMKDLRTIVAGGHAIPNVSLAYMPAVAEYDWCELPLLTDPDQVRLYHWPDVITISRISFFERLNPVVRPAAVMHSGFEPDVRDFLDRHWGKHDFSDGVSQAK